MWAHAGRSSRTTSRSPALLRSATRVAAGPMARCKTPSSHDSIPWWNAGSPRERSAWGSASHTRRVRAARRSSGCFGSRRATASRASSTCAKAAGTPPPAAASRRRQGAVVVIFLIPDSTVRQTLADSLVMVASDGLSPYGHPRLAGTHARVLGRYARDSGALSLQDAVRKMTLLPAQRLERAVPAMRAKGRIQAGADADITVFDPA